MTIKLCNSNEVIVKNRLYYTGDCNPCIHGYYFWLDDADSFNLFKCGENSAINYSYFIVSLDYDFYDKFYTIDDVLSALDTTIVDCKTVSIYMLKCDIQYTNVDMRKIGKNVYLADGVGNSGVRINTVNSSIKSWHNVFKKYMGFSKNKIIYSV